MNKSTNKHRHKWVEPFDAPFTYICSKCGKHKIKETMYTATYYDENMNPLGSKSPECVSKQPSIEKDMNDKKRFTLRLNEEEYKELSRIKGLIGTKTTLRRFNI